MKRRQRSRTEKPLLCGALEIRIDDPERGIPRARAQVDYQSGLCVARAENGQCTNEGKAEYVGFCEEHFLKLRSAFMKDRKTERDEILVKAIGAAAALITIAEFLVRHWGPLLGNTTSPDKQVISQSQWSSTRKIYAN